MTAPSDRRAHREDGSILLLSLGFCVIVLMLAWAVTDASIVFLARRDLAAAVDGTALAAAQQVDADAVYAHGTAVDLPLSADAVAAAVDDYATRTYPGQQIEGSVSADRRAVVVDGRRTVGLPLFGSVTVVAHAEATTRTRG